jgi:hypothetical protein
MRQETPRRTRLAEARRARIDRPEVVAAYEQTRLRHELAEAVRLRRVGWSQHQLAERAGMSQPGVAPELRCAPGRSTRPPKAYLASALAWLPRRGTVKTRAAVPIAYAPPWK